MRQCKKFINPVYRIDLTNRILRVGDTVTFILHDGSARDETVTEIDDDGRWICWDLTVNTTRKEDVRAVSAVHHFDCDQYYGGSIAGTHDAPDFS